MTNPDARVAGIDAAGRSGWVAVVADHQAVTAVHVGALRDLIDLIEPVSVIAIDIPLVGGLRGSRRADQEARRLIGPRSSSVFPAPPLELIQSADSMSEANRRCTAEGLPRLSAQAWALVPKMIEAAEIAGTDDRLKEVHPEVSFKVLAGEPLPWPKKSWNGLHHRRQLLAGAGLTLPDIAPDIGGLAADDLLDAAVAAWTARRISRGEAARLPQRPDEESSVIWC